MHNRNKKGLIGPFLFSKMEKMEYVKWKNRVCNFIEEFNIMDIQSRNGVIQDESIIKSEYT